MKLPLPSCEDANRGWPVSVSGCEAEAGNEKPSQRPTTLKPRTILLMAGKAQNTRNLHSSEAAGVVYLGDFEVWSKSLVACGEDGAWGFGEAGLQ